MNDLRKPTPSVFSLPARSETIETENFGRITVSELSIPVMGKLMERYGNGKDDTRLGYALVCESVTGANGERFTMTVLENLPARAMRDFAAMAKAATRVNGLLRAEVEKASPLP